MPLLDIFSTTLLNELHLFEYSLVKKKTLVVVAQLVERSLPIPELHGSNPVIDKIYIEHSLSTALKRRKLRKRGREWPIFLKKDTYLCSIKARPSNQNCQPAANKFG